MQPTTTQPFYVVSMGKFSALFIATMGLYSLYWFYKHWSLLGAAQQKSTQPILRTVLNVVFMPALCKELANIEKTQEQQYNWNPQSLALGYIVLQVISVLISLGVYEEKISIYLALIQIPLLFGHYLYLYKFQLVANRVCGDAFGKANNTFSIHNHIWIVFGIVLWIDEIRRLYLLISGQATL